MRAYTCPRCHHLLDLRGDACPACDAPLGLALEVQRPVLLGEGDWVRCSEHESTACNWLVRAGAHDPRCESCRLTRTVAVAQGDEDFEHLLKVELAKRRLVHQLRDLELPIVGRDADPDFGLAFDLLSSRHEPVTIGHANGVITIDLAESDDAHREMLRRQLEEPYRTVLGHVRHEVGHYYWTVLIEQADRFDAFRELFGDERASYQDALDRHYRDGAPDGWTSDYVSAYATMHPWEDWAETFAHYLHIRDTLQTAQEFGISIVGPRSAVEEAPSAELDHREWAFAREWARFTSAMNAVNRSMGHGDLYPFALTAPVVNKLAYVHDLVLERKP